LLLKGKRKEELSLLSSLQASDAAFSLEQLSIERIASSPAHVL
jgi:hypothetical protein